MSVKTPAIEIPDDPCELTSRYEQMAKLARSNMVSWAESVARSHLEHYLSVFSFVNLIAERRVTEKVADVGAVPGFITATLKTSGFDVEGVDIDPSRTREIFSNAAVPCHKADVENDPLPFRDDEMDLVLFNEILEHLRINPIHALRETFRVLKPGGSFLLSTPNITPLMRWSFFRGHDYQGDIVKEFEKLERIGHMGHIRLYSTQEVTRLLKYVGYEIRRVSLEGTIPKFPGIMPRILKIMAKEEMRPHTYVWAVKARS